MNTQLILVVCVSVVSALPQVPLGHVDPGLSSSSTTTLNPLAEPLSTPKPPDMTKDQMNTAPPSAAQAATPGFGPAAAARPANPFGPQFFGPGVGNPYAFPPNPLLVQRAKQVTATNPNVKVFVDTTGEVLFTDHFGREVEVVDQFGMDPLEIVPPGEQAAMQLEQRQQMAAMGLFPGGQGFGSAVGATPSHQVGGLGALGGGLPGFTPMYTVVPA